MNVEVFIISACWHSISRVWIPVITVSTWRVLTCCSMVFYFILRSCFSMYMCYWMQEQLFIQNTRNRQSYKELYIKSINNKRISISLWNSYSYSSITIKSLLWKTNVTTKEFFSSDKVVQFLEISFCALQIKCGLLQREALYIHYQRYFQFEGKVEYKHQLYIIALYSSIYIHRCKNM